MNSEVDICNMALDFINVENITSIDENTKEAQKCNFWYEQTRTELLLNLNATFSLKRAVLLEDANYQSVFGYEKAYTLPKDCLSVLSVGDPTKNNYYQIEGDYFFTDEESPKIRYIANVKEVFKFDPEFSRLFALKLASEICLPLTNDYEKLNIVTSMCREQYVICSVKYGRDNRVTIINKPKFRNARYDDEIKVSNNPLR